MSEPSNAKPLKFQRRAGPYRVLVAGGGLAGLFTALRLAPLPVTVLSPKPLGEGAASAWAQGGIAAAIGEGDTPENHAADTIAAGGGLTNPTVAKLLAAEARERIEDLLRFGVPFDRDIEGKLRLSREAAHGMRRIVRVNGDRAGRAVMTALIAAVASTPSITVLENVEAIELVRGADRVAGVYARRTGTSGPASFLGGSAVVLATGGIGHLYRVTTNPEEASGSGLAMAARAGAVIADPEFVQFHPTAFDVGRDPAPLASEAMRGDGALLLNGNGERFMMAVHELAELAPRDIVARAVHREIAAGRGAFLDCRALNLETAFPTAYSICQRARHRSRDPADPHRTRCSLPHGRRIHRRARPHDADRALGMWGNRVHRRSRRQPPRVEFALGSGCLCGTRGARYRSRRTAMVGTRRGRHPRDDGTPAGDPRLAQDQARRLRETMAAHVGVERSEASLKTALSALRDLGTGPASVEVRNMIAAAALVTAAAYERRESRGAHFRLDYPDEAQGTPRHSYLTLSKARAIMESATGSTSQGQDAVAPRLRAAV